jgi:FAD binding domain/Berberine and berberine like
MTQASGWLDGWASIPSVYAVAAQTPDDVAAAVDFARDRSIRLVVKGGGHSYHGTSNSPDSLLVWTRAMNQITLHDDFVPADCEGIVDPEPAVTVGAGAMWIEVYDAVTTRAGRYVQGGGCMTVGVAGLIQSGGFGSFSKAFGLAAAGLLEAEVVCSDGVVRTVNARSDPDLFWALKGGGGGTFGIVTRLTLRTRELPRTMGVVFGTVVADSDDAMKRLVARVVGFYAERLFNPHWGEQIVFSPDSVSFGMVIQGLSRAQAVDIWQPFLDWVDATDDVRWGVALTIEEYLSRSHWDLGYLTEHVPERIVTDSRPGTPVGRFLWAGNVNEAGQFFHAYSSTWLPDSLLVPDQQARLVEALYGGSRHWRIALHANKGLAGAPQADRDAALDTAMNPAVVDAFALAVIASEGDPAYRELPGPGPDLEAARRNAAAVRRASSEISQLVTGPASYVSESDFFIEDWQEAYWGSNYQRLAEVKRSYDPAGLFIVHHGVGSERWPGDGP